MSRYYHLYENAPQVNFRDSQEQINAITYTLNHFKEIAYTCNVGYDFRDHWNDLVSHRINLLGKDDGSFAKRA